MSLDLNRIRIIVYDLDGTVYDETRHFDLYARETQKHLPPDVHEAFWADYADTVAGRHCALRVGTFYDTRYDLVLEVRGARVLRALQWDGSEVPPLVRESLYPGPVQADQNEIINVGDLWWVPTAVSLHHGGDRTRGQEAFLRVRDAMSNPAFLMRSITGLKEAISGLRGRVVQVLATNSPQPDSEAILFKIGLLGLFDRMYFRSNKPAGLQAIFQSLADTHQVPFGAILSVGDNLLNEIAPARALGCQTVFIDPHRIAQPDDADIVVGSMTEFLPTLVSLAQKQAE